jgi:FkbH-like protein
MGTAMREATAAEMAGNTAVACADILAAVRREPTYTNHCRALEQLRAAGLVAPAGARRVALLSNFTLDPLVTCVTVQGHLNALPLDLYVGPYNEHTQEVLNETSGLHRFAADIVVLALTAEAIVPGVLAEPWQDAVTRRHQVEEGLAELTALLAALRAWSKASIVVANFARYETSPLGILDWQEPLGMERAIQELNHGLSDWIQTQDRVYMFDLAGLCAAFGRERAFDARMRLLADQPFAAAFVPRLAAELVRYLRATSGPARKCLVLDLDNTLWGGILGEDGPARLRLGGDAVGHAYREFQQAILGLHRRGILLALCSRNDETDAMSVVGTHPGMVLRPEHFAAVRVNWGDKVTNIQSLAAELNIGVDSLVFVDDDPFERQSVRERLPQVRVVDLPRDPALYRNTLLQLDAFDTLRVTSEDRARGRMYQEHRGREALRAEAGSLEEYLTRLDMQINAVLAEGPTRTRLFQLVHKTNQFNLTTRRYTEAEFDERTRAGDYRVFGIHVRDRLGDNGVVGLMILHLVADACDIETFLLSCRVLGRSIETGVLAYAVELARAAGARRLRGRYVATAKNALVRDLYEWHGFTRVGREGEADVWQADLATLVIAAPQWAQVRPPANGTAESEAAAR